MVHLWLVGKRVVDFLIVLIFCQLLRLRRYERTLVEIVVFEKAVGHFEDKFKGEGAVFHGPPTTVPGLSRGVVCVILRLAVFTGCAVAPALC